MFQLFKHVHLQKAPAAKPKKAKEVEKAKPEEKKEKKEDVPAENGEAKAEEEVRGFWEL